MTLAEIEAELEKLDAEELRQLALKSWRAFLGKEDFSSGANECSEEDSKLLAALDEAIAKANSCPIALTGEEVHARLKQWTSK